MAYRMTTCCFSGYRIEKMPFSETDEAAKAALLDALADAVRCAYQAGYTRFLTGMSTGFDLWAAQTVLALRETLSLRLLAAIPFDRQADHFPVLWKRIYNDVLLRADQVFALSRDYYEGCYAARNRFMVDGASRLICYYDGRPGGTAQTVRMAKQQGLDIFNLADDQLRLSDRLL